LTCAGQAKACTVAGNLSAKSSMNLNVSLNRHNCTLSPRFRCGETNLHENQAVHDDWKLRSAVSLPILTSPIFKLKIRKLFALVLFASNIPSKTDAL